jgi:hypothetical protein
MVIENHTFRLRPGVDESAFLAADAAFQEETYHRPGIIRRTLARGDGGQWLVVTLWATAAHAESAPSGSDELQAMIDADSADRRRYETLD